MKICIETEVDSSPTIIWDMWTSPEDIKSWNFASDEWCCPNAEIDLKVGGKFSYRMEAKDGSMGFDFDGTFTKVVPCEIIEFELGDSRQVTVEFIEISDGVRVVETFEAECKHSADQQKQGWQSILNNFKKHVESKGM